MQSFIDEKKADQTTCMAKYVGISKEINSFERYYYIRRKIIFFSQTKTRNIGECC